MAMLVITRGYDIHIWPVVQCAILKNDGVRQWEGLHPMYYGKLECLKPPTKYIYIY